MHKDLYFSFEIEMASISRNRAIYKVRGSDNILDKRIIIHSVTCSWAASEDLLCCRAVTKNYIWNPCFWLGRLFLRNA